MPPFLFSCRLFACFFLIRVQCEPIVAGYVVPLCSRSLLESTGDSLSVWPDNRGPGLGFRMSRSGIFQIRINSPVLHPCSDCSEPIHLGLPRILSRPGDSQGARSSPALSCSCGCASHRGLTPLDSGAAPTLIQFLAP